MMMPAQPRPNLILRQARLALGAPKTFFHAMLRTKHSCELPQRHLKRRVRQGVVVFHRLPALPFAEDQQCFLGAVATPALCLHPNLHRLDDQWSLFAQPNLDASPIPHRLHPTVRALEGNFRRRSRTAVRRRNSVQIANQRVGRNGQQIPLVHGVQFIAKTTASAHFIVPGHPGVRQGGAMPANHFQGELVSRAKLDFLGDSRRRQRFLSFVHSLGKYNLASTNACSSRAT